MALRWNKWLFNHIKIVYSITTLTDLSASEYAVLTPRCTATIIYIPCFFLIKGLIPNPQKPIKCVAATLKIITTKLNQVMELSKL